MRKVVIHLVPRQGEMECNTQKVQGKKTCAVAEDKDKEKECEEQSKVHRRAHRMVVHYQ